MHRTINLFFLLACLAAPAVTQTMNSSGPDYGGVTDFLDGRRTLLGTNDVIIGGLVLPTTGNTQIEENKIYPLPGYNPKEAGPEVSTRMFRLTSDTVVYTMGDTIYAQDPVSKKVASFRWAGQDLRSAVMTVGDFRKDGLNEVAIVTPVGASRIVAAQDPDDFSKGLFVGDVIYPSAAFVDPKLAAVAVANLYINSTGPRCLAMILDARDNRSKGRYGLLDWIYIDPKTLRYAGGGYKALTDVVANADFGLKGSMTAGRFGTTLYDQFFLAYYTTKADGSNPSNVIFKSYDYRKYEFETVTTDTRGGPEMVLKTGQFDPNSPYQQVAMKWNLGRNNVRLGIFKFDNTLQFRLPNFTVTPVGCSTPGLSVGISAGQNPCRTILRKGSSVSPFNWRSKPTIAVGEIWDSISST